jgi:hypothetical protein
MPPELTVIYYTAQRIPEGFARRVRMHLLTVIGEAPLISVTQRPLDFGQNICVGEIGFSTYNVYRQILVGAEAAETPWIACCEDDTLYVPEHFNARPPPHVFWYNHNRWWVEPGNRYRYRNRANMCGCVVDRRLAIDTLRIKFAAYPDPIFDKKRLRSWGEPGRYEGNLGLPEVRRDEFRSARPIVTFNHDGGLNGRRGHNNTDWWTKELPPWGKAGELWERFYGAAG